MLRKLKRLLTWALTKPKPAPIVYEACPACGLRLPANDGWAQKAHMEQSHSEIIAQRLRAAGFEQDDSGEWQDRLAVYYD
jgi:hypothetical protein